jgi:hypothetical protein
MSTQNIYNTNNLPTNEVLAKYFTKAGLDLIKKRRFEVGCGVSVTKMREMLRLDRFVCNNVCYLEDEAVTLMREQVIKNSILKLDEL